MADTRDKPKAAVRRFDMFAQYNRRPAAKEGQPAAQVKGHALRLAKPVAARAACERCEPDEVIRVSPPAPWKLGAKQGLRG